MSSEYTSPLGPDGRLTAEARQANRARGKKLFLQALGWLALGAVGVSLIAMAGPNAGVAKAIGMAAALGPIMALIVSYKAAWMVTTGIEFHIDDERAKSRDEVERMMAFFLGYVVLVAGLIGGVLWYFS